MDLNSIMSSQLASLQQTLQLSLINQATNAGVAGTLEMLEQIPAQSTAPHPYKGQVVDIQA